jgi:sentrin-specific protease 1
MTSHIINLWLGILAQKYPDTLIYDTFLLQKLRMEKGIINKRALMWAPKNRKKGWVFTDCHQVLIPVHHLYEQHWSLCIIDLKVGRLTHHCSLGWVLCEKDVKYIVEYITKQMHACGKKDFVMDLGFVSGASARQDNNYDCGLFTCMNAEYACKSLAVTFEAKHCPYLRRKIVFDILEENSKA